MPHHQACVCPNVKILNEVLGGRLSSASWSPNLGLPPIWLRGKNGTILLSHRIVSRMGWVDLAPKFLLGSYPLLEKSRRNAQCTSHNQRMGDTMFLDLRLR